MKTKVTVTGVTKLNVQLQQKIKEVERIADEEVEKTIRQVANEAAADAPVDTGKLSNSLPAGVQQKAPADWEIIDGTEYTLVQEYTHESKRGFIRKAVWNHEDELPKNIQARVKGLK